MPRCFGTTAEAAQQQLPGYAIRAQHSAQIINPQLFTHRRNKTQAGYYSKGGGGRNSVRAECVHSVFKIKKKKIHIRFREQAADFRRNLRQRRPVRSSGAAGIPACRECQTLFQSNSGGASGRYIVEKFRTDSLAKADFREGGAYSKGYHAP